MKNKQNDSHKQVQLPVREIEIMVRSVVEVIRDALPPASGEAVLKSLQQKLDAVPQV